MWKLALESKFEPEELASLRQELVRTEQNHFFTARILITVFKAHYETRLEKMHFLQVNCCSIFSFGFHFVFQAELKLVDERHGGKFGPDDDDKTEGRGIMDR